MQTATDVGPRFVLVAALVVLVAGCQKPIQPAVSPPIQPKTTTALSPERATAPPSDSPAKHPRLDDGAIARAVRARLQREPGLDARDVQVRSLEGVVELTGTVPDLLSKRRAVQFAETVRGVRAASNRIQVVATPRPDADIEREVRSALLLDGSTASYGVKAKVDQGVVTLTGTVQSGPERQLATRVAEGVRGVRAVEDKIVIDYPGSRSDADILADVKSRLHWDALIENGQVEARVKDGRVFLSGGVGSAAERRRAGVDAWVPGVLGVDTSDLTVEWWARNADLRKDEVVYKTDEALADAIQDAAAFDPRVESAKLTVEVQDGAVTLRGVQETKQASLAAEALAKNTLGVVSVQNSIRIQPGRHVSDSEVARNVRQELLCNPIMDSFAITTDVRDGTVTLTGKVATPYERALATTVAGSILGVQRVENDLQVTQPEVPYVYNAYLEPYEPYVDNWRYTPPSATRSDREIAREIRHELAWDPRVRRGSVHVEVVSGTATLTGIVGDYRERAAATDSAFASGALVVDNRLRVASKH